MQFYLYIRTAQKFSSFDTQLCCLPPLTPNLWLFLTYHMKEPFNTKAARHLTLSLSDVWSRFRKTHMLLPLSVFSCPASGDFAAAWTELSAFVSLCVSITCLWQHLHLFLILLKRKFSSSQHTKSLIQSPVEPDKTLFCSHIAASQVFKVTDIMRQWKCILHERQW